MLESHSTKSKLKHHTTTSLSKLKQEAESQQLNNESPTTSSETLSTESLSFHSSIESQYQEESLQFESRQMHAESSFEVNYHGDKTNDEQNRNEQQASSSIIDMDSSLSEISRFENQKYYHKSRYRRWLPSVIAITLVIVMNLALLGPFGQRIPGLSESQLHIQQIESQRTHDILEMEIKLNHYERGRTTVTNTIRPNIGSRNLSKDEGGVMEYTRRRHRILGDYTHEDVSEQFDLFGKWSVSIIYFAYWFFLMFPHWILPIGRPGISLGGGLTMVVWRYLLEQTGHGPKFYAERVIIMEPLFLLFGLMLTTIYLEKMERGGLFDKLRDSLDDPVNWKRSAKIMAMSTLGSAAVMNDSVVLIFSGVVVDLCVQHKVANSMPYLLSLATTANIGSALTMTGNPQNILIVSLAYDNIGWLEFASNMVLPVLAATFVNSVMMFTYYGRELFPGSSGLMENLAIMFAGNRTPQMLALEHAYYARRDAMAEAYANQPTQKVGWSIWSIIQVVIVILFLVCFGLGLDVCVVAISAGAILMVVNSYKHQYDAINQQKLETELITESETTLTEVDYGLLLLFIGQFLLIGSFNDTGVPQAFFNIAMGDCAQQMTSVPCVYWFVMIITILSNIASNVPVCQMLAATFPYATPYDWMQVSFSATIAGNLTMLGSAANMIVAFQAAKVGDRSFTAERHAPFGIPSTLLCLYAGTFLLTLVHFSPECSVKLGTCEDDGYY